MKIIYSTKYLEENDNKLINIQQQIERKKQMLLKKQQELKNLLTHNEYLEEIHKDYYKYNNIIIKQKQEQIHALEDLDKYIKELKEQNQLTQYNIEDAKYEQQEIMKELHMLKYSLDKIIM